MLIPDPASPVLPGDLNPLQQGLKPGTFFGGEQGIMAI
jgi:hypothetical protein